MTIIITGGHPTPAFALVEHIQTHRPDVKIVFVGRVTTRQGDHQPSPEQIMAKRYQTQFVALDAPKFAFGLSLLNLWRLVRLLFSTLKAGWIVHRVKPRAIVCFGSYLAVPVAIAGHILGIKVITHEQTRGLGRANQLIARFADCLALSHPVAPSLITRPVEVVGNLLRPSLFVDHPLTPSWWPANPTHLTYLYITGGEQGSEVINAAVGQILPQLVKNFVVVHQCGPASQKRNYYQELSGLRENLSATGKKRYVIREWLTDQELNYVYHQSTLVLSRSGANTVDEITAFKLPALLIPLPFSQGQEQLQNAMSLVKLGAAMLLEQKDLTTELLLKQLNLLRQKAEAMRLAFPSDIDYSHSSIKLWQIIEKSCSI